MEADHDFYDIVGARVYAEILGWYRKRMKDPYTLVGLIDGVWAGFANGRLMDEDVNISLHTMALMRGGRIGAIMYYAKAYYAFEILGNQEWWATYESYNGWLRWGVGMAQNTYPWPEYQHELGGARVYYVDKKYWDSTVKDYVRQMIGADLVFDVPKDIRGCNQGPASAGGSARLAFGERLPRTLMGPRAPSRKAPGMHSAGSRTVEAPPVCCHLRRFSQTDANVDLQSRREPKATAA